MSDSNLLEELQAGKADQFEEVFRKYYEILCRFAMKYVSDPAECEEIVQDLFVRLWQKREQLSIATSLKSYLYQSTRNACLNYIKHANVKVDYQKDALHTSTTIDKGDTLVALELEIRIEESLSKLPKERKRIFLMSRNEGLKYREIAQKLDISVKTVENQMGKALKFLKAELSDYMTVLILMTIQMIEKLW